MKQIRDFLSILPASARLIGLRRYYLLPLIALIYPLLAFLFLLLPDSTGYEPVHVLGSLMGMPLSVMACFLGVRIIASECEQRTLEIAYTVPGGAHRIWIPKIVAALVILVVTETLLAVMIQLLLTDVTPGTLYGAFQLASFYLVLAMALAAFLRSEITGALVVAAFFAFGLLSSQAPISPFWNPLRYESQEASELLATTIKHRATFALLIIAIGAMGFARAQRREKMLR